MNNLNKKLSTTEADEGQIVLYTAGLEESSSSNEDFYNEDNEECKKQYPGSTEFPASSVQGVAQSIGVNLSEDIAGALGDLAIKKLRAAVLLAVGFADHQHASGLRTLDFSKAEQVLSSTSYGHRSFLPDQCIRPIVPGNISILEEGSEIDIIPTASSFHSCDIRLQNIDPEFHVHDTFIHTGFNEEDEEIEKDDESVQQNEHGEDADMTNNINNHADQKENEIVDPQSVQNGPKEACKDDENLTLVDDKDGDFHLQFDKEWLEYIKVFVNCFLDRNDRIHNDDQENQENVEMDTNNENEFQECIVEDLKNNSALPIADLICDFFCDYLDGLYSPVSSTALFKIVSVVDAVLCGSSIPPYMLKKKMTLILITILHRALAYEVQPRLVKVLLKILKNYAKLLIWTCKYITSVLEIASEDINNDKNKCLLHGALLLANGLELMNIKIAKEYESWGPCILNLKRNHCQAKEDNIHLSKNIDAFLEEEFTKYEKATRT